MSRARLHPDGEWKDISAERYRQRLEAERIVTLAWVAGAFDDLDPPPTGTAKDINVRSVFKSNDSLVKRCVERAEELLCGQYPEVRVKGRWRGRFVGFGWLADAPAEDPRPRVQLEVILRRRNTYLRPKAGGR